LGGRNSHPEKVLRIRYRTSEGGQRKIKSRLVFFRSDKKKLMKGGRVLRIGKVGREEMTKTGEHNPMEKPEFMQTLREERGNKSDLERNLFRGVECLPSL